MKLNIVGNGAFGSFLKVLLADDVEYDDSAEVVVLAVPFSAYEECAKNHSGKSLINVCSVQEETNKICLKYSQSVVGIHPLFGRRTPVEHRHSILTTFRGNGWCDDFLNIFKKYSTIIRLNAYEHDKLMARTHLKAVEVANSLKSVIEDTKDIPDNHIPHSFRLLRQFVTTLRDMPSGTLESILANTYKSDDSTN